MIPAEFDYVAPDTLDEALNALASGGEDAKLLAGGHSLLPLMKLRLAAPTLLVDLRKVPGLDGISNGSRASRIGAMTTHTAIANDASLGLIAEVSSTIADPQVRNRGTLGGSLAHGDPASDQPAILLAYEGSVTVRGASGERDDRGGRPVPGLPHDRGRRRRGAHVGELPGARRLRVRLPEVQPPQGGLGDGRRRPRSSRRRATGRARTSASGSRT